MQHLDNPTKWKAQLESTDKDEITVEDNTPSSDALAINLQKSQNYINQLEHMCDDNDNEDDFISFNKL